MRPLRQIVTAQVRQIVAKSPILTCANLESKSVITLITSCYAITGHFWHTPCESAAIITAHPGTNLKGNQLMSKILGIDLGTTNSCMAVMEGGEPAVLENSEGARTTPSVVAFTKNGERLVGQAAKRQAVTNPQNTIFSAKRLIGRKFAELTRSRQARALQDRRGRQWRRPHPSGSRRREEDLLARRKSPRWSSASSRPMPKPSSAKRSPRPSSRFPPISTTPSATPPRPPAKSPASKCCRIINEPTAASLAYGLDKKNDEKIAVYDLGGGTFDISVLEIGDGVFEVIATDGDTHLGGDDWDNALIDWIVGEFKKDNGIDLSGQPDALQRIKEEAEKAKIALSSSPVLRHQPALHHGRPDRPEAHPEDAHPRQAGAAHRLPLRAHHEAGQATASRTPSVDAAQDRRTRPRRRHDPHAQSRRDRPRTRRQGTAPRA